jgi:hypothetical protein
MKKSGVGHRGGGRSHQAIRFLKLASSPFDIYGAVAPNASARRYNTVPHVHTHTGRTASSGVDLFLTPSDEKRSYVCAAASARPAFCICVGLGCTCSTRQSQSGPVLVLNLELTVVCQSAELCKSTHTHTGRRSLERTYHVESGVSMMPTEPSFHAGIMSQVAGPVATTIISYHGACSCCY